jgi:DNA gyrase/topoisomerase IV subunit B
MANSCYAKQYTATPLHSRRVDVGRFKGLGEMMSAQLKETTMDPARRTLLRVVLLADDRDGTADSVERLMGTKAEARFAFISDKAEFASDDLLCVRIPPLSAISGLIPAFWAG